MASMQNSQAGQQFSADQLAWAKQQYYENKATTDKVVEHVARQRPDPAGTKRRPLTSATRRRYQPIEDKLIGQVNDWASPDAHRCSKRALPKRPPSSRARRPEPRPQQQLESFGINPSSTRYAAMDVGNRTATGASAAAAGTNAANLAQQQQLGLESQAINIGRGYPGQTSAEFGGSTSAGASANNVDQPDLPGWLERHEHRLRHWHGCVEQRVVDLGQHAQHGLSEPAQRLAAELGHRWHCSATSPVR